MSMEEPVGETAGKPVGETGELPEYAERVLDVADAIPPGRVMTYGDVAEWLGEGGPRQVGRVMALYGGTAPWWRVVRADGTLLPGHELRALGHYREEGTPLRTAGPAAEGHVPKIDMRRARWDGGTGEGPGTGGDAGGAGRAADRGAGTHT
ncbi:MGMT family protein [Streptomyces sp. R44]|uniref:MGMT family protein n=1 Tax=Streptomyces sp. R44 TaxID=3238633 RepID=A0AB39T8L5_9ACTN